MKKIISKQIATVAYCITLFSAYAKEIKPVASWTANNNDNSLIYRTQDNNKVISMNVKFYEIKEGNKSSLYAYFQNYNCDFKAQLPVSLWKRKGDFTVSGKFMLPNIEKNDPKRSSIIFLMQKVGLTVNRAGNKGAKGQLSFNVHGGKSKYGNKGGHRYIDSGIRVDDGRWHNFIICITQNKMMMWVDGKKIAKTPLLNESSNPLPFKNVLQIGGSAKGLCLRDLRFYNRALPNNFLQQQNNPSILTEKITLASNIAPCAELLQVKAISGKMRLPFQRPTDATVTDTLRLVATPGEYEPVSFVIHAKTNLPKIIFRKSALYSKDSAIKAENIDIKLVKCWYQAGTAWETIRNIQHVRVLTPELLLNDDSLVKVDYNSKRNYVKVNYPGNAKYIEMTSTSTRGQPGMNNDQFPVKDSEKLLPFSVKKDQYKQIWLTVHVPQNTKPGLYNGKIEMFSDEKSIGNLKLKLRVLPFKLASPKTYYNLNNIFASSIYYKGILASKGTLTGWNKNETQYRADLQNMLSHGVTAPMLHELERKNDFKDFERALRIREELGISNDPLYLLGRERNLGYNNTTDPKKIAQAVSFLREILAIARKHGIKQVYVYGIDESAGSTLEKQKTIWKAFHKEGVKVYEAGFMRRTPTPFELAGGYLDTLISSGQYNHEWAKQWHSKGGKIWSYQNPQGGVENPLAYRRGFGFPLWKANYDGACTYVYNHGYGHTWNDFDHKLWRDHNLTYPTINGVIDTIAWEGYREAMDDIRYGTTLKEYIAKAAQSSNPRKKNLAIEASKWLNSVDTENRDLDTIRLEVINWILKLR